MQLEPVLVVDGDLLAGGDGSRFVELAAQVIPSSTSTGSGSGISANSG